MRRTRRRLTATVVALLLGCITAPTRADEPGTDDRALYVHACASCHGLAGDGRGPVAAVLVPPPRDLRKLARRYGNPLPVDRIAKLIDGRELVKAHGPRSMPVWGEQLGERGKTGEAAEAAVRRRIESLVAYLATIQPE